MIGEGMVSSIEIELITYNRCEIVEKWIRSSINYISKNKIALAVYDSSTNDDTEKLIYNLNKEYAPFCIKYIHLNSNVRVDEKVLKAILDSNYKYTWPIGDSRLVNFADVKQKVLPSIETGCDFVCLWNNTVCDNDGKKYTKAVDFFYDCFWHATWLGGIIFKKEIFDALQNTKTYNDYMEKFYRNDGFSYLGVFYDLIAKKEIDASFVLIHIEEIGANKKTAWIKRYLEVWCDNLCYLVDHIPDEYNAAKDKVLKETWEILGLDGYDFCFKARQNDGINKEIYEYYKKLGLLNRVTKNVNRIKIFSTWPYPFVFGYWFVNKCFSKIKNILKRE